MPLVRIGEHAIDTEQVHRIMDDGKEVRVYFKPGPWSEPEVFTGAEDLKAWRDYVSSLPVPRPGG